MAPAKNLDLPPVERLVAAVEEGYLLISELALLARAGDRDADQALTECVTRKLAPARPKGRASA